MSGSSGNLVAAELRRHDHDERGRDGARLIAAEHDETITDYTEHADPPVTTDGAMSQAQLAALGHRAGTLIIPPTRTRTRTRSGRPVVAQPVYERRSEVEILRSTIEGLVERVSYLEAAAGHLSQELYEIRQGWRPTS